MKHKILAFITVMMVLTGCTEDFTTSNTASDGYIRFSVVLDDSVGNLTLTRSIATQDTMSPIILSADEGQPLYLHRTVERFPLGTTTRSTMINNVTTALKALGYFGVSGYHYDPTTQSVNSVNANFFHNAKVTESGGEWRTTEPYYFPASNERMSFYAYAPYTTTSGTYDVNRVYGDATTDYGPMTLEYTVNPDPTQQTDLITAAAENIPFDPGTDVSLPFSHALTAVRFVLGNDVALGWTLTELSIEKIINHARYKVGTGWLTNESDATTGNFTLSLNKSTSDADRSVTGSTQTFLMIPQTFNNSQQQLTIKLTKDNVDKTLHYKLAGNTWTAGTMITYAITTSSINVVTASISYPADWGGEDFSLKDSYDDGATVGVYAVDINNGNKVVIKNMKLTYDKATETWNTENDDVLKYNRNYDYYFYYPYSSSISGGRDLNETFSGSSASDFFSGVISNWTVTEDQSTADKLLPNDLHIGQAVHDTENFTQVSVAMQHAMGLAKITLETKDVTPRINLASGNTAATTTSYTIDLSDKLIYRASNLGIKDYMCPNSDASIYYYIVKGTVNKTFASTSTGDDQWKSSLTGSIANGACYAATAELKSVPALVEYDGWYFDYTGGVQSFTVSETGVYQIECWGASGGDKVNNANGGCGGYVKGDIYLTAGDTYYIYIGQQGAQRYSSRNGDGAWNGGGRGINAYDSSQRNGDGGGATDIRLYSTGTWNEFASLKSRIMVAGAGGGACDLGGGNAGGLEGYRYTAISWSWNGTGGTQTAGGSCSSTQYGAPSRGSFGYGSNGADIGGGGGGGYYGGAGGCRASTYDGSGGGGSSFISGHEGCNAIAESSISGSITHTGQPNHYSGLVFTNTRMIDGAGYEWTTTAGTTVVGVPKTLATGYEATGHTGNGFVRIIKIN